MNARVILVHTFCLTTTQRCEPGVGVILLYIWTECRRRKQNCVRRLEEKENECCSVTRTATPKKRVEDTQTLLLCTMLDAGVVVATIAIVMVVWNIGLARHVLKQVSN